MFFMRTAIKFRVIIFRFIVQFSAFLRILCAISIQISFDYA